MKCPSCNLELGENAKFCPICGATVIKPAPVEITPEPAEIPVEQPVFEKSVKQPAFEQPAFEKSVKQTPVQATFDQPVYHTPPVQPAPQQPAQNQKLMGPWGYVGWQLLFSIPLVGFILLIVFSFDDSNLNRRNFARSYWCALLIGLILILVTVILLVVTGVGLSALADAF